MTATLKRTCSGAIRRRNGSLSRCSCPTTGGGGCTACRGTAPASIPATVSGFIDRTFTPGGDPSTVYQYAGSALNGTYDVPLFDAATCHYRLEVSTPTIVTKGHTEYVYTGTDPDTDEELYDPVFVADSVVMSGIVIDFYVSQVPGEPQTIIDFESPAEKFHPLYCDPADPYYNTAPFADLRVPFAHRYGFNCVSVAGERLHRPRVSDSRRHRARRRSD